MFLRWLLGEAGQRRRSVGGIGRRPRQRLRVVQRGFAVVGWVQRFLDMKTDVPAASLRRHANLYGVQFDNIII